MMMVTRNAAVHWLTFVFVGILAVAAVYFMIENKGMRSEIVARLASLEEDKAGILHNAL